MNLQPQIDITAVRATAKARWKHDHKTRAGLLSRVEKSVPWWLIIITGVMFALSAPHTIATFSRLSPLTGWLAPFGVEFGLLYAAFRRKQARQHGERVPWALWGLEALLFVTAIVVNGVGSLAAVVSSVGVETLSVGSILSAYGTFPAITQAALFLVPLAALIIPIGTGVTGEGLATLVFERDHAEDVLESAWGEVEYAVLRRALYDAYFNAGYKASDAARLASQGARGTLAPGASPLALAAPPDEQTGSDTAQTKARQARQLLADNPSLANVPLRVLAEQTGINKDTWAEVKRELAPSNGKEKS